MNPLRQLKDRMAREFHGAQLSLDFGADPDDAGFLDLRHRGHVVVIQWAQGQGFSAAHDEQLVWDNSVLSGADEVAILQYARAVLNGQALSWMLARRGVEVQASASFHAANDTSYDTDPTEPALTTAPTPRRRTG